MTYYLRLMNWTRLPEPTYQPLGSVIAQTALPDFKQGRVYRFSLAGQAKGEFLWLEYIIVHPVKIRLIDDPNRPGQVATLAEVFLVRLSEYEQFVEPVEELNA